MLRYARVFPPAHSAEHSTPVDSEGGSTRPRMGLLVLRVGFCVLVLGQKTALRKKQIYSPLVFVVTLKMFSLYSLFPVHNNFVLSDTNDRSYSLPLDVPLVIYSDRWAVKRCRAYYTGFGRRHNRSMRGYCFRTKGGHLQSKGGT